MIVLRLPSLILCIEVPGEEQCADTFTTIGTNGWFIDGEAGKPWSDGSDNAAAEFWAGESALIFFSWHDS